MSESETMFTFDAWRRYLEFDADQVGMRETVKVNRTLRSKVCGGRVFNQPYDL